MRICEKCEAKIAYGSCLVCNPIKKGERGEYDLLEMIHTIEQTHGYDYRNYENHLYPKLEGKGSNTFNVYHKVGWEFRNYELIRKFRDNDVEKGYNKEGMDFYRTKEGKKFHDDMEEAYRVAPDGKCQEVPYMDFWHLFLDVYRDLRNDSYMTINWGNVLDACKEDWQKKIGQDFVDKFGREDYFVSVCW